MKKISSGGPLLFWLVLFSLPLNLAKHWVVSDSYVQGSLVDYLIPTFYLSDGLLIILGLLLLRNYRNLSLSFLEFLALALLLGSGLGGLFFSAFPLITLWRWWRLFFLVLFCLSVGFYFNFGKDLHKLIFCLGTIGFGEGLLSIIQWFTQASFFGYLPFGGPSYRAGQWGLAQINFFGSLRVRSYGTFPHPNALGAFLTIIALWLFWYVIHNFSQLRKSKLTFWGLLLSLLVVLGGLFFTFSRSAWWVLIVCLWLLVGACHPARSRLTQKVLWLLIFIILLGGGLGYFFSQPQSLSWIRRFELTKIALAMVQQKLLWGVGLGNFTQAMPSYGRVSGLFNFYQPVHNFYLLVLAEVGILGFIGLTLLMADLLYRLFQKKGWLYPPLLVSLVALLLLGFFDHYWWSLPQTSGLFWLTLGLTVAYTRKA